MAFKKSLLGFVLALVSCGVFAHGDNEADYHFTKNLGQLNKNVKYHCKLLVGDLYLEQSTFTFDLFSGEDLDKLYEIRHNRELRKQFGNQPVNIRKHAYQMHFVNANPKASIQEVEQEKFMKNYFRGSDPSKWVSGAPSYEKIRYQNIYQNTDLEIYGTEENLKYDFVVRPGGSPENILIEYKNVNELNLSEGALSIELTTGTVVEMKPFAYQMANGQRKEIPCAFSLNNNRLSFVFPDGYDTSKNLIIDPTWIFSSLTGSTADNWGFTATYDDNENFYGGGIAFGFGYPTTIGAYNTTFGGNIDAVITKFDPTGASLIYSTYIGGTDADQPHSLVTDADSNLVIMGVTSSNNFPTTAGAYDQTFNGGAFLTQDGITYANGTDIFVLKLDNAGAALIGSTYLGGTSNDGFSLDFSLKFNYADHARGEVVLGSNNEVIVASSTASNNFPATVGSYSQTLFGGYDGIVARLNPTLTTLDWSTYLGGTGADAAYSVRVDTVNNAVFMCGGTTSNNLGVTAGVIGPTYNGGTDGFITKLDNTNGALMAMTYVGTVAYDQSYIIEVDRAQDVYVVGQTKGAYPVSPSTYSVTNGRQFIHKMNNDLTVSDFSTVFGSGLSSAIDISITAFLVDNCDNIYVGGWGGFVNNEGSTNGMPLTGNALQATTDGSDFYFIVLDRDAQNLLYGTYFGSSGAGEHVDGGTSRFDKKGTIYEGVCAACGGSTFPTSPGAYSATNGSTNCNFGAIKIGFDFQGVNANATAPPNLVLCGAPYSVTFSAGSPTPPNNYWDFGDGLGTAVDTNNPSYVYADTGSYTVMYVAIDSSTCNIADTVYFTVNVIQNDSLDAQFNIPPYDPCTDSLTIQLDFTGSGADSLYWAMGNGDFFTNDTSVTYTYTTPGTYVVTFEAYDTLCNVAYTVYDTVFFNPVYSTVNAVVPPNVLLCTTPYSVDFDGNVPAPPNSYWDFGDGIGIAIDDNNPTYVYADTGSFTVMYVAIDSSTCNIADTAYFNVLLVAAPPFSAVLDFQPPPPCGSDTFLVDLKFTGANADSLVWDLGDGNQISNIDSLIYSYTNAGSYIITMTAYNFLCNITETISNTVTFIDYEGTESIIPNVFTPNGDGLNDELQFVGVDQTQEYSIEIFNRWGIKVYEGKDALAHWDGESHDSGVYFYILKYTDVCSTEEKRVQGYVTLLR